MRSVKNILGLLGLLVAMTMFVLSCTAKREISTNEFAKNIIATNSNTASNSTTFDASEFARMKALWASKNLSNYQMVVEARSMSNMAKQVSIDVHDGKPMSIIKTDRTDKGVAEIYALYGTVETIFNIVEQESLKKHDIFSVIYDPSLGYPSNVICDTSSNVADDEFSIKVVSLTAK